MFGFNGADLTSDSRTDNMSERDEAERSELGRSGIERVPADVSQWSSYRYSHARDALAVAKRGAKA
jgi:hypothetical protein